MPAATPTSHFAANTEVAPERTRAEIERLLAKHGASQYQFTSDSARGEARIVFKSHDRLVKFVVETPALADFGKLKGKVLPPTRAKALWEQAVRQRWRCLLLIVKAKLEAVASGVETFESAFLAHIMLADGSTVATWIAPQLEHCYRSGRMPTPFALLPPAGST